MADAQTKKERAFAAAKRQYLRMREVHDWYFAACKKAAAEGEELELTPDEQADVDKMLRWYENRRKSRQAYKARQKAIAV